MEQHLTAFVRDLQSAKTFERCADACLGAVLSVCEEALATSSFRGRGRMLRATVHVRPSDTYRRVASRETAGGEGQATPYVHSASAWRWVRAKGAPIAIDVHLGVVEVHDGQRFTPLHEETSRPFQANESRKHLLGRDATTLLVLPLCAVGGEIAGMISVEADARSAMGTPFVWPEATPHLLTMANVAAPHLLSLPSEETAPPASDPLLPVVGPTMRPVIEMLRVFSRQEETILLSGPTGAGKSRLARWCHGVSPRSQRPFETVDLATVPEELQMAELFGWKRGAFTGALKDTQGAVARAEGGTLFIDEVDKLSLKAQAGLLRVLEERKFRPLGEGAGDRAADVRFLVGTNTALLQQVRTGAFREDLYYRIHVLPVRVPPLSERSEEVAAWAAFMLKRRHAASAEKGEATLSPEAEGVLSRHPWPGNLRQLDNIVRRAYALFMVTAGPAPARIVLDADVMKRALLYEGAAETRSFAELLQAAAAAFVAEAERRKGTPLDLDLTDAFRGVVLGLAAQKLGSVEEAFKLLGKASLVQHRNHMKALRKELSKVDRLYEEVGAAPSPFATLLESDE